MVAVLIAIAVVVLALPYLRLVEAYLTPSHATAVDRSFSRDWDVPPLVERLKQCPTLASTSIYWREDYTDHTPFYRPLSLTYFWILAKAFGATEYNLWMVMTVILRAIFDLLLFLFIRYCTKSPWTALTVVVIFAGSYSIPMISALFNAVQLSPSTPQDIATTAWKDQPTLIADCLCLGALLCILRDQWIAAIALTMVSTFFKESGWITYFLGLIVLWAAERLRDIPKWVYPSVLGAIALPLLLRHSAGMGWVGGLRMGNNQHWPSRLFGVISGSFLHDLLDVQPASALFALLIVGGFVFTKRMSVSKHRFLGLGCILAAIIVCLLLNAHDYRTDIVTGGEELFDPGMGLPYIGQSLIFVIAAYFLLQDRAVRRWSIAFTACSIVAALPFVAATQVLEHALHLCYAFQSALIGMSAIAIARRLKAKLEDRVSATAAIAMPSA